MNIFPSEDKISVDRKMWERKQEIKRMRREPNVLKAGHVQGGQVFWKLQRVGWWERVGGRR